MTNAKRKADKTAKNSQPVGENTPKKTPKSEKASVAAIVWADGTDEEIAADLTDKAPDWENWTEREKRKAVDLMRAFWGHPVAPTVSVENDNGVVRLRPGGGNATLHVLRQCETFATNSDDLTNARLGDLSNYHSRASSGGVTSQNLSASIAFVTGGGAQDTVQAALLTQMAATHDAAMRSLSMVGSAEYVDQQTSFGNLSTKLLNLYAKQAETLAKLQRGAEQTVRHVYVDARTQTAYNYPPTQSEVREQSHEQHDGSAFGTSMLGYDPAWNGVPVASDEGQEPLPDTRRQGRGTGGE